VVLESLIGSRSLKARLHLAMLTGDETLVATLTMEKQARKAVRAEKKKELKHKRMELKLKIWTRKLKLAETKIKKISRWLDNHEN
jgi:phage-related protein